MLRTPHTFAEIARVGPIASQARKVVALLEDPARSAVLAVALPAELSISETLDLEERVTGAVGRPLDAVVVNGVLPRRFSAAEVDRVMARDGAVPGPVAAAARRQHGQATAQQSQLRRLRRHTAAHVTTLPYVAAPYLGPEDVRGLADELPAAALGHRLARALRDGGSAAPALERGSALGAQAGLRAHEQLVERALVLAVALAEHRAQPAAEEADRDRDEAREGQRRRRALRVRAPATPAG